MNIDDIRNKVNVSPEYDFLRVNEHLGDNIMLLAISGSHSYGTDTEASDIDIRGCSLNTKEEMLLYKDFSNISDAGTDTKIFSFKIFMKKLVKSNPDTIELLGINPDMYLHISEIGHVLLNNSDKFLSASVSKTFGGYIHDRLKEMDMLSKKFSDISDRTSEYYYRHHKLLSKHMMYIIHKYLLVIDILNFGEVRTYREAEHDLLMSIKMGEFLTEDFKIRLSYYDMITDYRTRLEKSIQCTSLPDKPDHDWINKFIMSVNESIITGKNINELMNGGILKCL